MRDTLEGKCKIDEVGRGVTFTKVIEVNDVSKDELYERLMPFFTYYYKEGEASIQVADKEQLYILARGLYKEFINDHNGFTAVVLKTDAEHVIRIDFKDSRLRVLITVEKMVSYGTKGYGSYARRLATEEHFLNSMYPIKPRLKGKMSDDDEEDLVFLYQLYKTINTTFDTIGKYANKLNDNDENW